MSAAARGPKPSLAPKPRVTLELNGNQGRSSDGSSLVSDDEVDHEAEAEGTSSVIGRFITYVRKPPGKDVESVSEGKEDEMIQKMDEDWRLTEEVDSLWVSGAGLTAESEEVVEMIETEVTEDMEADGCDAGEALADTDGLSVGDISVNSIDEDGAGDQDLKKRKQKLSCTADDPPEEPGFHMKTSETGQVLLLDAEDKEEETVSDCGVTCNILKLSCGHRAKEKIGLHDQLVHEPYYVSSEDVINRETMPRSSRAQGAASSSPEEPGEHGQTECLSSEDYVKIENKARRTCQKKTSFKLDEHRAGTDEASLNHLDFQPRFRLVSISVPTDTDTSLTSSLSETQLLSPNDVFGDEDDLEGHIVPFLEDTTTDTEQDMSEDHVYEEPGRTSEAEYVLPFDRKSTGTRSLCHHGNHNGVHFVQRPYLSGFGPPALSSSPMLNSVRHKSLSKPHYLSLYPRSLSMEGQDTSQRHRDTISSSGSFSRVCPLPSTPTSVVDIPPPFELACITKKPITKSSPSLLLDGDSASDKNRKKKSSIKRFLMLKFRRKTESSKSAVDVNPSSMKSSPECSHHCPSRLLDLDTHSLNNSPQLGSRSASSPQASSFTFYKESKRKGNSVAFLNRSVVRVESFEDRSRVPFTPLPLTKPRSISFPNTDTSDYENVPPISSDYENLQVPQRRPVHQGPFIQDFFDRPSTVRVLSSANDTDGYVDMSSLPGFRSKAQSPEEEPER